MNAFEKFCGMMALIFALPFIALAWIGFFLCNDDSREAATDSGSGQPVLARPYELVPYRRRSMMPAPLAG